MALYQIGLMKLFDKEPHNSDFSLFHVKNPVGDFSPTGFIAQPIRLFVK